MLRNIFELLTQPLRDCFKSVNTLLAEWDSATKPTQGFQVPYKIEPPETAAPSGPQEISVAAFDRAIRTIDMSRPANTDELWRIYGYGAFRREVTLHLTHFTAEKGGRASVVDVKLQRPLGTCTTLDLIDLLAKADAEEKTVLRNPNYDYISRAIDELMKMEQWTGFGSQKDVAIGDSHWIKDNGDHHPKTAAIFEFKPR